MQDDDAWFAPKRFGYGAGLPIAWQGWVLVVVYGLAMLLAGRFLAPTHPRSFGVVVMLLTAIVVALAAAHTRGGWRWRWGGGE
jgi:hypothetical protein